MKSGREDSYPLLGLVTGTSMGMLDEEEQEMAHDDVVEDVVEANDDQEPDVEGHIKQDTVEIKQDTVEANDDEEPDVEAHIKQDVVEDVVE
jgi:hypothetical protein